jgi:hypothetical protein
MKEPDLVVATAESRRAAADYRGILHLLPASFVMQSEAINENSPKPTEVRALALLESEGRGGYVPDWYLFLARYLVWAGNSSGKTWPGLHRQIEQAEIMPRPS